jgi:hypothetical protein
MQEKKRKRKGEEGRERREKGQCSAQKKIEGKDVPVDVSTGGVRGGDKRGDRRAENRQEGVRRKGQVRRKDGRGREYRAGDRGDERKQAAR